MSDFNNGNNGNSRPKTPLNDYRYPHPKTKEPLPGGKYPAQAYWELTAAGKVVFKVQDGVFGGGDNAYKKKEIEMIAFERNAIFQLLREAATDPNFTKSQYTVRDRQFIREGGQAKMSDNPMTIGVFTVIRDSNGVVQLGFSKSDFKALFVFDNARESTLVDFVDGEFKPAHARMSRLYVLGYLSAVEGWLNAAEFSRYQPPKPKNGGNGNGNGGGGWNNNNGGNRGNGGGNSWGGGGNAPADDFADDIPF
ncbi:hypothetical protein [Klebsiella quasipneumoniae]|uniref:hypothetical protein n=1 Tax=Klebsiella quasipneumoniae TaxID=1463165 RepID=UPI0023B10DED|nr:hypothetical protein [Klebsiella quasipneumoniae]